LTVVPGIFLLAVSGFLLQQVLTAFHTGCILGRKLLPIQQKHSRIFTLCGKNESSLPRRSQVHLNRLESFLKPSEQQWFHYTHTQSQ
jgi:hypothetical protein